MKILNAQQIREADAATIENEPITSLELMERAASRCAQWMLDNEAMFPSSAEPSYSIFCGPGNNGGDGLVIARLLAQKKRSVQVFLVEASDSTTRDYEINHDRLAQLKVQMTALSEDDHDLDIPESDIVIDAIFGTGLSRPLTNWLVNVVDSINASPCPVVAIDIPSGMFVEDNSENDLTNIVKADLTLSFQVPKLAYLLPDTGSLTGNWLLLNIGLDRKFIEEVETKYWYFTNADAMKLVPKRGKFSHKGTHGHSLLAVGSKDKLGAGILAAKSCLRSGTGLLSVQTPDCGYSSFLSLLPEAMHLSNNNDYLDEVHDLDTYAAIGIGPGIGLHEDTQRMMKQYIQNAKCAMVFDADALNILAENKTWMAFLPKGSVLTPHPGEFRRLVGDWSNDYERLQLQCEFSVKHQVVLVLKGAHTSISGADGKVYFNSSGNPGMATGGSGDVLCGTITAFIAQGLSSLTAALLGVYVHGFAGDLACDRKGEISLLASDLIEDIPAAIQSLSN